MANPQPWPPVQESQGEEEMPIDDFTALLVATESTISPSIIDVLQQEGPLMIQQRGQKQCYALFKDLESAEGAQLSIEQEESLSVVILTAANVLEQLQLPQITSSTECLPAEEYDCLQLLGRAPSLLSAILTEEVSGVSSFRAKGILWGEAQAVSREEPQAKRQKVAAQPAPKVMRSLLHDLIDRPDLVGLLLQHPNIDVNAQAVLSQDEGPTDSDLTPLTPLAAALLSDSLETVKLLLTHPATDPNLVFSLFKENKNPIHLAIAREQVEALEALLSHPKVDVHKPIMRKTTQRFSTPLLSAVEKQSTDMVGLLLAHPTVCLADGSSPSRARTLAAYLQARRMKCEDILKLFHSAYEQPCSPASFAEMPAFTRQQVRTLLLLHRRGELLEHTPEATESLLHVIEFLPQISCPGKAPEAMFQLHFFYHPPPSPIISIVIKAAPKKKIPPKQDVERALKPFGTVKAIAPLQSQAPSSFWAFILMESVEQATAVVEASKHNNIKFPTDQPQAVLAVFKARLGLQHGLRFEYTKKCSTSAAAVMDADDALEEGEELDWQEILTAVETDREGWEAAQRKLKGRRLQRYKLEDDVEESGGEEGAGSEDDEGTKHRLHDSPCVVCVDRMTCWTTDSQLMEFCSPHGSVVDIRFSTAAGSGRSLGCAFVEMSTPQEALTLAQALHLTELDGQRIIAGFVSQDGSVYPATKDDPALCYMPTGMAIRRLPGGRAGDVYMPDHLDEDPTSKAVVFDGISHSSVTYATKQTTFVAKAPQPSGRERRRDVTCYTCGALGHISTFCPVRRARQG